MAEMEKMMDHSFGGDDEIIHFDEDENKNQDEGNKSTINPPKQRSRIMSESFIRSPQKEKDGEALEIKLIKTIPQDKSDDF